MLTYNKKQNSEMFKTYRKRWCAWNNLEGKCEHTKKPIPNPCNLSILSYFFPHRIHYTDSKLCSSSIELNFEGGHRFMFLSSVALFCLKILMYLSKFWRKTTLVPPVTVSKCVSVLLHSLVIQSLCWIHITICLLYTSPSPRD